MSLQKFIITVARLHPWLLTSLLLVSISVRADWTLIANEQGRRIELDPTSINSSQSETTVRGRVVLDKPIIDHRTSSAYQIIEITSRIDCKERTSATLKRIYYKDTTTLLREEDIKIPQKMPVRTGTPDEKILLQACRPRVVSGSPTQGQSAIDKANLAAAEIRKFNDTMIENAVKEDTKRLTIRAGGVLADKRASTSTKGSPDKDPAPSGALTPPRGSDEGEDGREPWGRLSPHYSLCATGTRQSPIDLQNSFLLDLDPITVALTPAPFSVLYAPKSLSVTSMAGGIAIGGQSYALQQLIFHRPSEMAVAGKRYDMDAQFILQSDEGKIAIMLVFLEKGAENKIVQDILNQLPLEQGREAPATGRLLALEKLLPDDRRYFTLMGSLTQPPCTEDVLWIVFKAPQSISPAQLSIFERLHPPNARPLQPAMDRIIKESR